MCCQITCMTTPCGMLFHDDTKRDICWDYGDSSTMPARRWSRRHRLVVHHSVHDRVPAAIHALAVTFLSEPGECTTCPEATSTVSENRCVRQQRNLP